MPKPILIPSQFRKRTLKVPESRTRRFGEPPENFAGPSRVIFRTFPMGALRSQGSLVHQLSGEVPEVCTGLIFLKFISELVCT